MKKNLQKTLTEDFSNSAVPADEVENARRKRCFQQNWGDAITLLRRLYGIKTILDIGARDRRLKRYFSSGPLPEITHYDPVNPELNHLPSNKKFDLVTIVDFLEYMEEECMESTLRKAFNSTRKCLLVSTKLDTHLPIRNEYADMGTVHTKLIEIQSESDEPTTMDIFDRKLLQSGSLRMGMTKNNSAILLVKDEV